MACSSTPRRSLLRSERGFFFVDAAPLQWGGLALSFIGISVAMGVPDPTVNVRTLAGDALLIAGGLFWAATALVVGYRAGEGADGEDHVL